MHLNVNKRRKSSIITWPPWPPGISFTTHPCLHGRFSLLQSNICSLENISHFYVNNTRLMFGLPSPREQIFVYLQCACAFCIVVKFHSKLWSSFSDFESIQVASPFDSTPNSGVLLSQTLFCFIYPEVFVWNNFPNPIFY